MRRYENNEDLPEIIRVALPDEAQTIYRRAYNEMWAARHDTYQNNREQLDDQAHRAGWAAVEEDFEHVETTGSWQRKADAQEAATDGLLDHLKSFISR